MEPKNTLAQIYPGNYIKFGNTVGHIKEVTDTGYLVNVYFLDIEHFSVAINDFLVTKETGGIKLADKSDAEMLRQQLHRLGYCINDKTHEIVAVPSLKEGDWIDFGRYYVVLSLNEGSATLGTFKDDGCIEAKPVCLWEHPYKKLTVARKKAILAHISKCGYEWDQENLTLIKSKTRVKVGGTYWHITDRFNIRAEADNRTPKHDQRYFAGNYFLSLETANAALQYLLTYLRSCHQSLGPHEV